MGGDGSRVYSQCVLFSCLTLKNSPTHVMYRGVCVHTEATTEVSIYIRYDFGSLYRKYCKGAISLKGFLQGAVRIIGHCVAAWYTLLAALMYQMSLTEVPNVL